MPIILIQLGNLYVVYLFYFRIQAELDANRTTMDRMLQRTDTLCTRLDIEKSQYLNPEMVGYSTRHLKEVKLHNTFTTL